MYSRPPMGRFPRGMRVPENYSGNAFGSTADGASNEREDEERKELHEDIPSPADIPPREKEAAEEALPVSRHGKDSRPSFGFDLGRFFPSNRSFGMEDFLIIALILLLAQNDTDDDTLIFLILLLFIK